jgi:hypothetical protein
MFTFPGSTRCGATDEVTTNVVRMSAVSAGRLRADSPLTATFGRSAKRHKQPYLGTGSQPVAECLLLGGNHAFRRVERAANALNSPDAGAAPLLAAFVPGPICWLGGPGVLP